LPIIQYPQYEVNNTHIKWINSKIPKLCDIECWTKIMSLASTFTFIFNHLIGFIQRLCGFVALKESTVIGEVSNTPLPPSTIDYNQGVKWIMAFIKIKAPQNVFEMNHKVKLIPRNKRCWELYDHRSDMVQFLKLWAMQISTTTERCITYLKYFL